LNFDTVQKDSAPTYLYFFFFFIFFQTVLNSVDTYLARICEPYCLYCFVHDKTIGVRSSNHKCYASKLAYSLFSVHLGHRITAIFMSWTQISRRRSVKFVCVWSGKNHKHVAALYISIIIIIILYNHAILRYFRYVIRRSAILLQKQRRRSI